ncbi:orotidine 5'-phosphate decarboxylase / HUMPS family protein [Stetteria hydrogenophila]
MPGLLGSQLSSCKRLVQVALDLTKAWDALRIASQVSGLEGVILEAGTPLIKSEGVGVARLLKALPGSPAVVADMKTMDTGALEVALAAEAGADASTVLALADDATIRGAVEEAERRGIALMADLINVKDPVGEAERLARLGVHVAILHIGIDVQRRLGITASKVPELISKVAEAFNGPVAVAGGIKPEEAGRVAEAGASIIIIGGGITKAGDPRGAAIKALESAGVKCG